MNKALDIEKVLFDLWAGNALDTSNLDTKNALENLVSKGFLDNKSGDPKLNEIGRQYLFHERTQSEMVELLSDLEIDLEERNFLANVVKNMIDKPFVYEILKSAYTNPNRNEYPSVDLGSFDDIEHGLLFGAETHIMIDPLISGITIDKVIQKLNVFGSTITENQEKGYGAHVFYKIGDTERELYLLGTEVKILDANIYKRRIKEGIFAVIMKGLGGKKEKFSHRRDSLDHYSQLLKENGLLLLAKSPELSFKKIGIGKLSFESHVYDGPPGIIEHTLYQKTTNV